MKLSGLAKDDIPPPFNFHHILDVSDYIQKDLRGAIEAWLAFWNALPAGFGSSSGRLPAGQPPIVAILSVIFGNDVPSRI